jgi:dipeptidyl aminopeptidase/acylaminoacyl peptidase
MDVVPAARCIGGRELTEPRPAPDGTQVAFVGSWRGLAAIHLVPAEGGPERVLTAEMPPRPGRGLGGGCYDWLPDGSGVVYAGADGAVWLQLRSGLAQQLTPADPDRAPTSPAVSPDGTRVAYVVDLAEVRVLDRRSGTDTRLDDGAFAFVNDPAWSPSGATVLWQAWSPPHMPWDESAVVEAPADGSLPPRADRLAGVQQQQPRVAPDGTWVRVRDDTGVATVWWGGHPLVADGCEHAGPTWGPGQRSYAISPGGHAVAVARNERGFGRLIVVRTGGDHPTVEVARGVHGQLGWVGRLLVALRSGARTPTQVVAYDTATWQRRTLAVGPLAGWEDSPALVEPELVEVEADDGVVLHARRYRTPGPVRGLICWVHGGPTDQWMVTFLPRIVHWVSRGFDVLVPDHRGSTGHGRAYTQALRRRWGELDVADTAVLLHAVHRAGPVGPDRTVLMGASAGGFTVLGLAARHPELAACAAVAYPVCDLPGLAATTHRFEAHYTDLLIGPWPETAQRWQERSPLSFADRLTGLPLLVLHGDADPVVPVDQSRALAQRVADAGGDITLHVYEGEGHGFRRPEHQLDEYERVAAFVEQHLARPAGR